MQTPIRSTQLRDDRGTEHQYQTALHGAVVGMRLGAQLLDLFGETLRYERGLGACIEGLAKGVLARGDADFVLALLEHTSRDGKKLTRLEVDVAYQGNYGELLRCLVWIIGENFGGFSGAAVEEFGGRLTQYLRTSANARGLSLLSALVTGDYGRLSELAGARGSTSETAGASTTSSTATTPSSATPG